MKQLLLIIIVFVIGLIGVFAYRQGFFESATESELATEETEPQNEETKITPNKPAPIELAPVTVTFADGTQSTFQLAKPFRLAVAAEGLNKARFMSMSPDGRLFVPDMVNMNLSHDGKIYVLDDFNKTTKQFQKKTTYLSGLRGPNSVAFYTDKNDKTWIYIALTAQLIRYPYNAGDAKPSGQPEVITDFPNKQVSGETSVVWHITRTIKFHNDRLYVAVGSGCNACEQPEGEMRAMIYSLNPDGSDKQVYADGLRNAVGFTWGADEEIYATINGVDHLGPEAPNDVMYKLTEGKYYGWPYCYELNGKIYPDTYRRWSRPLSCDQTPLAFSAFEPHAAPLGLQYFSDAHPILQDAFLVALHGSFEPEIGTGYHLVRVSKSGEQQVFMDGFLGEKEGTSKRPINIAYAHSGESSSEIKRLGRPVDILQNDANSFFFTDDHLGKVYYVYAE
ncbi:MAG: glucose/sorbosone dehydrogenase [Patescibacteria group bacterium]